ncbi:MAG: WD40 repeat domain-containing protein [Limnospira sp.]
MGVDGTIGFLNGSNTIDATLKVPNGTVRELIFTPDGDQIVTLGGDQIVRFWDLEVKPLSNLSFSNKSLISVGFSPNGRTIATADSNGIVRSWNFQGNQIQENSNFLSELPKITNVSFSPNGQTIATTGEDGMVRVLDLQGNIIHEFQTGYDVRLIKWSQDGKKVAGIVSDESNIGFWNFNGDQLYKERSDRFNSYLKNTSDYHLQDLTLAASGEVVVVGKDIEVLQSHGNIDLFDFNLANFSDISSINIIPGRQFGNFFDRVQMSDDGEMLIATSYNTVSFWNLSGEKLMEFSSDRRERITHISLSPDNGKLAVIFENGDSELWNLGNLDELLDASCDRIRDYLHNNPNVAQSDRTLCDP